jgi:F-type H+-transporting ATPase subunit delta
MANRFSRLLKKFGLALGADRGDVPHQDGGSRVSIDAEHKTDSVSRVYAQALLELAQADGQAESLAEEAGDLLGLLGSEPDLDKLLSSRALNSSQRSSAVDQLFKGKVSDVLYRFIQVINRKDRLGSLAGILVAYRGLVSDARGDVAVDVYVAESLSDEASKGVAESIGNAMGKQVKLRQNVDPELIGGLKVRVGDRLIDGSVATQLRIMKRKLVDAGRERARQGGQLED